MGLLVGLAALVLAAPAHVFDIGGGAAMTLPAHRHVVRIDPQNGNPATWLLAAQQDGADGHWLSFYRSDDEGAHWSWYAPIQDHSTDRDEADLLTVGNDVAMIYSYEGPTISGSTAHDVYFQWWRWDGGSNWNPSPAVKIFDSTSSSTAYLRGEIAIDSLSRIWCWAQRLNSDNTFTMVMAVSSDGGNTFAQQPSMDSFANRPGGRIMPVNGNQLMLLYSTHGVDPGYMRLRNDSDPVNTWGARVNVFPEGIYHGAALSAANDGAGGVYLLYNDVNHDLFYRHYRNGSWSARQTIDTSEDWAVQPAITRVGGALVVFWNHAITDNTVYHFDYQLIVNETLQPSSLLDGSTGFKGYPAAVEVLPNTVPDIPCFYGDTPDANSSGYLALVNVPTPNYAPPPPPDGGTPDAGPPDAGPPDAGSPPDGGTQTGILFSDDFARTLASGLGPAWNIDSGCWRDNSKANSDCNATDMASAVGLSCADCAVSARLVNFAAATAALDLRQQANGDRYDVALLSTGHLQIRKHLGATTTVLGDVASGISDLTNWSTVSLSATGSTLVAAVNGVTKLTVTDSSIGSAGTAGLWTTTSGILFEQFVVSGTGSGTQPPPDGGTPDAGSPPDAGTPDAGTPDAGTPDAGTPDAGTPDAGTPDAGSPDAGPPDAGNPPPDGGTQTGVIFSDDFARTLASGLGPNWTIAAGAWRDNSKANSDLDALDRATVNGVTCSDCEVDAKMVNFGGGESMLEARVNGANRYALALMTNGNLQIRRYLNGATTVLGTVASGADLSVWNSFSFTVTGSGPVVLTGSMNGKEKLSATDTNTSLQSGSAGIAATVSGILFENFVLSGVGQGAPPPPPPDGGTPDAGPSDGGTQPPDGGTTLTLQRTYTGTDYDLQAVDGSGTAYGVPINGDNSKVYASTDGRTWSLRGVNPSGASFFTMTALADGTLLGDTYDGSGHVMVRSTNHGQTWSNVLTTGQYRTLTPHSWAQLNGVTYYLEYQVFTGGATPIRIWASTDNGATWTTRYTFQGHRHGHGLLADPQRGVLWAFFGDTDPQCAVMRSTDGGFTWVQVLGQQPADLVDATLLSDGSLLAGQDISYQPDFPHVAKITTSGDVTNYVTLPAASYSTHAISGGGYLVGVTRELDSDVTPPDVTNASLWGSADGVHWSQMVAVPRLSSNDDVRAVVYWELNTGEIVMNVYDAAGYGGDGRGYALFLPVRQ